MVLRYVSLLALFMGIATSLEVTMPGKELGYLVSRAVGFFEEDNPLACSLCKTNMLVV